MARLGGARPGGAGRGTLGKGLAGLATAGLGMVFLMADPTGARAPEAARVIPAEAFRPVIVAPVIRDPMFRTAPPSRPLVAVATPEVIVETLKPVVAPKASPGTKAEPPSTLAHQIQGLASWYCRAGRSICHYKYPDGPRFDAYAAAGPGLRAAICGSARSDCWRGRTITVDGIRVKLIDWCQCYKGEPHEKLLDLYYDVFARTGSRVTLRW